MMGDRSYSVARMNCVVEINASENGEDIGLEDGDEQFECRQRDAHHERQWRDDRERAGPKQAHDETTHHLERDVSGEHIGEKTNRQGDRSGKERNQFNRHQKGKQRDRHSRRHEQPQETRAIVQEAVNNNDANDKQRKRARDRELTRHRECVRNEADDVAKQHEHEEREYEGKEAHAIVSAPHVHGGHYEFVGHLRDGLKAARNERARARSKEHQRGGRQNDDHHEKRGIGKRGIDAERMQADDWFDNELMDWIHGVFFGHLSPLRLEPFRATRSRFLIDTFA